MFWGKTNGCLNYSLFWESMSCDCMFLWLCLRVLDLLAAIYGWPDFFDGSTKTALIAAPPKCNGYYGIKILGNSGPKEFKLQRPRLLVYQQQPWESDRTYGNLNHPTEQQTLKYEYLVRAPNIEIRIEWNSFSVPHGGITIYGRSNLYWFFRVPICDQ